MKILKISILLLIGLTALSFQSCQQAGGNDTGSEYMPDMAHSAAYEANYYNYYYLNTWGSEDEYYEYALPKKPVAGTVSRTSDSNINIPSAVNSVTYDYGTSEEERTRAMEELIANPYPITDEGLERGKELYTIFCAICHGDKGDGGGYLVRDGGVYPVQPANFLLEEHLEASNGRYYNAIMHGRNLMGAYNDKINYEERWQVIHYIRALQAKELKKEYSQVSNTLNDFDTPAGADYVKVVGNEKMDVEIGMEEEVPLEYGEHKGDDHSEEH